MKITAVDKEIETAIQDCISNLRTNLSDSEKFLVSYGFKEGIEFVKKIVGFQLKRIPEEYDRRRKMLSDDWKLAESMFNEGSSIREIAKHFNVSNTTIYKHFNLEYAKQQDEYRKNYLQKKSKEDIRKKNENQWKYKRHLSIKGLI